MSSNCKGTENFETYIVTSTEISAEQIKQLKSHNLPIIFYNLEGAYYDEVGGLHDNGIGWNPNGVWCGECTRLSCADCPSKDMKKE